MSTLLHRMPQDPLRPPQAPGVGRGFGFALLAHALLVVALSLGVHWHTQEPPAFEAELWSAVPVAAAPKPEEPPPEPQPQPTPPQPPQPSAEELQAQHDAEIAVAKEREKKKQEQLQAEAKAQEDAKRKQQQQEQAQKLAAQQRQQQQQQQQLQKQQQAKADKEAAARADAQRQAYLRRIQGMAGATGDANATGTAQRSSGPSASYTGRIIARIKPNIIYNVGATDPRAEVQLHVAPDGTIISRSLTQSSGDPEWDAAVLRAIDKTGVLPRDIDGSVPSVILIGLRPHE